MHVCFVQCSDLLSDLSTKRSVCGPQQKQVTRLLRFRPTQLKCSWMTSGNPAVIFDQIALIWVKRELGSTLADFGRGVVAASQSQLASCSHIIENMIDRLTKGVHRSSVGTLCDTDIHLTGRKAEGEHGDVGKGSKVCLFARLLENIINL